MKKIILSLIFVFGLASTSVANHTIEKDSIQQEQTASINFDFISCSDSTNNNMEEQAVGKLFNMVGGMANNMITGMIIMSIVFFILILLGLTFYFVLGYKRKKQRQEMIMKCIESGQPIPPFLLEDQNKKSRYLTNGIIWTAVGFALLFILGQLAIIPLFVGIAFFILYFVAKHNSKDNNNEQRQNG